MAPESHSYRLEVLWTGADQDGTAAYASYRRDHLIRAPGKPDLAGSSDPAFRGAAECWNPEELLVASLSACHMLWYLHLASESGIIVRSYRDRPSGEMRIDPATGGGRFVAVTLAPEIVIDEDGDIARARRLHAAAHRRCFIAASVNFPVRVKSTIRQQTNPGQRMGE
ncbi:MAG: OsmC family peroxiredoxin [Alphaproteobacteria bacterium]|nr:MAG: OsmC family peroxiredoxin [Alphaproteobacteria bacterium]